MSLESEGPAAPEQNTNAINVSRDPLAAARFKLRHRLLLLTAIAVLPAFIIVGSNHFSAHQLRSQEVEAYAAELTDTIRDEVVRGLSAAATLMLAMGRAAVVEGHNAAACEVYAGGLQRDLPTVLDIAVADETGAVYCHSGISSARDIQSSVDRLVEADEPGLVVGNYTATPQGATLPIGMALRNSQDMLNGYVQLHVNMAELVRLVTEATQNLQSSTAIITDRNGMVLLSLPQDYAQTGRPLAEPYGLLLSADQPDSQRVVSPQGISEIVGYRPATEALPIAALFALPEAPLMAPIERAAITNSAIALAGAALAFLMAWLFGSIFIERPIGIIDRTIRARRDGDQRARTDIRSDNSELGVIARSVDQLFDELDHREQVQRRTEEQRDLFAREVQHRVKNLLAIIQVIARQSLARPDASSEVRAFESRIDAIIRTNTKLLAESDHAGLIDDIVKDAVSPFVGDDITRLAIKGPEIRLRDKVAAALAMAMHELATNAVKYGALSTSEGHIEVHWKSQDGTFDLEWIEQDGPTVSAPSQTGFGSVLISRVLEAETRGQVTLSFEPEGCRFKLSAAIVDVAAPEGDVH